MDWQALKAEFPRHDVDWRAQSVSQKDPQNPKAMALAYIDARAVMDRLDAVCGPGGWQCAYRETPQGRVLCTLSILVDGEWVAKSDGSGATDIEGEKGGISGALKRAAVVWGIGRYLYDMETPWVPCELYNGRWNKWKVDPWTCVRRRGTPSPEVDPGLTIEREAKADTDAQAAIMEIDACETIDALRDFFVSLAKHIKARPEVKAAKDKRKEEIEADNLPGVKKGADHMMAGE